MTQLSGPNVVFPTGHMVRVSRAGSYYYGVPPTSVICPLATGGYGRNIVDGVQPRHRPKPSRAAGNDAAGPSR